MADSNKTFKASVLLLCTLVSFVYVLRTSESDFINKLIRADSVTKTTEQYTQDVCASINITQTFTEDEINRANSINDFLTSIRNGNPLLNFSTSGQNIEQFGIQYAEKMIPFVAIGAVMLVLSLIALICCCCDYACFRNCAQPSTAKKTGYIICSIALFLLMGGAAAVGWYYSADMSRDFTRTSCSGANFIAQFSVGSPSEKWIGLTPAVANLTQIKDQIGDTLDSLPNVDDIHKNVDDLYNKLKVQTQQYYTNNSQQVVVNPIPGQKAITPDFIAQLGPPDNTKTVTGLLGIEFDAKYQALNKGLDVANSSIKTLKKQTSSITDTLQEGIDLANGLNNNITVILSDYSHGSDQGQTINDSLADGITIFFILACVLTAFLAVGILNTFTCKAPSLYKLLAVSRYILFTILIVCFFVSMALFPLLIAAMETCNATDVALKNETVFNGFAKGIDPGYNDTGFATYTHTCLFGDGDILANFGISNQLQNLSAIFDQMQNLSNYYNMSVPDSIVIPIQEKLIDLFQTGQLPASGDVAKSLIALNQFTNDQYSGPSYKCYGTEDTWMLNSINCTSSFGQEFYASDDANYNYGSPTCLGFDQYANYKPNDRYAGKFLDCQSQGGIPYNTLVTGYVGGFQAHVVNVNKVFQELADDLNVINGTNAQFMQQGRNLVEPLLDLDDNALEILNLVGNNQTGLITNFNCAFLKTNGEDVINHLCIAYLPDLFLISVAILAFGILTFIALLPVFCLEKMRKIEKSKKDEEVRIDDQRPEHIPLMEVRRDNMY